MRRHDSIDTLPSRTEGGTTDPQGWSSGGRSAASRDALTEITPHSSGQYTWMPRRAMIVDEDEAHLRSLCGLLQLSGLRVYGELDQESALRRLQKGARIEVLITTYDLGQRRGGLELAARVRRVRPWLPLVMMTERPPTRLPRLGEERVSSLTKPFLMTELFEALRTAVFYAELERSR